MSLFKTIILIFSYGLISLPDKLEMVLEYITYTIEKKMLINNSTIVHQHTTMTQKYYHYQINY